MQPDMLPLGGAKKIYSKNVSSSFERKIEIQRSNVNQKEDELLMSGRLRDGGE